MHLLDHTGKKTQSKKFWIDWSENTRAIEKSKTIKGEAAQKIITSLKLNLLKTESHNFCGHDPVYGIEVTTKDGKKLKTSLCFKCSTWVKPKKRLSIKGKHGIDNALCLELRKHIELPKSLLKKPEKK